MAKQLKTISKQQRWQVIQRGKGLCITCGEPAVTASHCEEHRVKYNKYMLKRSKRLTRAPKGTK